MIDLNRIRSLKTLEEMKRDLTEFISNPEVRTIYIEEYGWGLEDYEDDKDQASYLLEKVEKRLASLGKYIKGQATKRDSLPKLKTETTEVPSEQ